MLAPVVRVREEAVRGLQQEVDDLQKRARFLERLIPQREATYAVTRDSYVLPRIRALQQELGGLEEKLRHGAQVIEEMKVELRGLNGD